MVRSELYLELYSPTSSKSGKEMNTVTKNKTAAEAVPEILEAYATSLMASDPDRWIANWTEDCVLTPIKEEDPDLYSWIVDWEKREIAEMANTDLTKEVGSEE